MEKLKCLNKAKIVKVGLTVQKKKVLTFLTITLLIIASFYAGYSLASPSNTFTISSGVYPSAASYTIYKEGSTYYAKNAYGAIVYSGTDASQIINQAINSLAESYQKEIDIRGDVIINTPIILNSLICLRFEYIGASTTFSGNMIEATNKSSIKIFGGTLEGNYHATNGLFFNLCNDVEIYGVTAKEFLYDGIAVSASRNVNIFAPHTFLCKYRGIYIYSSCQVNVFGGLVEQNTDGLGIGGTSYQIAVYGTKAVNNAYFYGWGSGMFVADSSYGVDFVGVTVRGNVNGLEIDSAVGVNVEGGQFAYNKDNGISIYGTSELVSISNVRVFNNGQDASCPYRTGIFLWNATYVNISNSQIYDTGATQQYGIREYGTSNYNVIVGTTAISNIVVNIKTSGTNTKVNLSYNGTTWIP